MQPRPTDFGQSYSEHSATRKKSTSNAKKTSAPSALASSNSNGGANSNPDDDSNWKLLKFLCDRIEENQKRESEIQARARLEAASTSNAARSLPPEALSPRLFGSYSASSTPREQLRPIPLSTDPHHLLAKRKHRKSSTKRVSSRSQTPSHKQYSQAQFFSSEQLHHPPHAHTKGKSHTALYTSAFQFGDYDMENGALLPSASVASLQHRHTVKPQSQVSQPFYSHSQSHSQSQPRMDTAGSTGKSASIKFATPINANANPNTSHRHDLFSPAPRSSHQAEPQQQQQQQPPVGLDEKQQETQPLSDPVASLVSLVRRVTKIYGRHVDEDEQKVADPETIRQIFDRYIEFYQRPPLYPDHLKKFGMRFYPDVRMTYAAAKDFMESLSKIAEITSPNASDEKPSPFFPLSRLRDSAASVSSPLIIKHNDGGSHTSTTTTNDETELSDTDRKHMQRTMKKKHSFIEYGLTLQIDADQLPAEHPGVPSVTKPEEKHSPTFEFYNMSDLELLQTIKKKVSAAESHEHDGHEHDNDAVHLVWEREYAELEHRLHRAYTANPMSNKLAHQYDILKRDRTFLSLKHMSESTNVDDTDHDAAVFLLKTYFPDDDDEERIPQRWAQTLYAHGESDDEFDYNEEDQGHDHVRKLLAPPTSTSSLMSPAKHNVHKFNKSSDFYANTMSNTRLQVKPQPKHIRSVTADRRGRLRASSRRNTMFSSASQSETLSLYDRMVQKARQSKIKSRSQRFLKGVAIPSAGSLRATESAPAQHHGHDGSRGGNKLPTLQTIPSESAPEFSVDSSTHHHAVHSSQLFSPNEDLVVTPLQAAFSPGDDDVSMTDPAFRQLTTLSLFSAENEEQSLEHGGVITPMTSLHKDMSALSAASYASFSSYVSESPDEKHTQPSTSNSVKFQIPRNLLSIMAKYGDRMERWDIDVFELMDDPMLAGKGLVFASFYLFRKSGLLEVTEIAQANLWRFLESVQRGYKDNPYHNRYHAVDVLFSTHFMFQTAFFKQQMTVWDQLGAYIAALCHDLGHPGFNNEWFINTAGNLALLYGNESVLENFHISETFRILNEAESNWMLSFPSSVRRYLSTVIKRSILATDLKVHGTKVIQLQNMVETYKHVIAAKQQQQQLNLNTAAASNDNDSGKDQLSNHHALVCQHIKLWRCESIANYASLDSIKQDDFRLFIDDKRNQEWTRDVIVRDLSIDNSGGGGDDALHDDDEEPAPKKPRILGVDDERIFLIELTIHACDVANPCKPLHLAKRWANRYLGEAFNQGDHERNIGIPVSSGFDRHTTKLASSQLGFIIYVVKRLFALYGEIIDITECVDTMLKNEQYWIQEKQKMLAASAAKKKSSNNLMRET